MAAFAAFLADASWFSCDLISCLATWTASFIEVRKDKVVILAESAELPGDIDIERAQAAKQRAEQRLSGKRDEFDFRRAEMSLQRAINRLDIKNRV